MFIKKPPLPVKPALPTKVMILEDLEAAKDDDVVFKTSPDPSFRIAGNVVSDDYEHRPEAHLISLDSPQKAYEAVKSFSQNFQSLEKHSALLEQRDRRLSDLKTSLMEDVEKIRRQFTEGISTASSTS